MIFIFGVSCIAAKSELTTFSKQKGHPPPLVFRRKFEQAKGSGLTHIGLRLEQGQTAIGKSRGLTGRHLYSINRAPAPFIRRHQ